ncbi:hypothetical protein [Mariniphaga sp.]|uniref:hypothetical protein n=1 Tax=Mariniphaga sp. TaxID=1954475 RepID=UPI00356155B8
MSKVWRELIILREKAGRRKTEDGSWKHEVGRWKREDRRVDSLSFQSQETVRSKW